MRSAGGKSSGGSSSKKRKGPARATQGYYNKIKNAGTGGGFAGGGASDAGYGKKRTAPTRTRAISGFNEKSGFQLGGPSNNRIQGGRVGQGASLANTAFGNRLDASFSQNYGGGQAYSGTDYGAYANMNQYANGVGSSPNLNPNLPQSPEMSENMNSRGRGANPPPAGVGPNWNQAPAMGFLSPDQLSDETNDKHGNMYPKLKTSITFNSNGNNVNRKTEIESNSPFMLMGVAWYWWAAVIGGFLLVIIGIGLFLYCNIYKRKKKAKKKMQHQNSIHADFSGMPASGMAGSSVVNSFTTTESFSSSSSSTKKPRLADFIAQTDGNVVSSKGRVSLNKAAVVPFNPAGTSMPMNHPAQVSTKTGTLQAGNGATNTFQNINYDNFDAKSVSGFGVCDNGNTGHQLEQYNQVNPHPVPAGNPKFRTLRRQPNSFNHNNPNNSPIMNEMYEDVNLPQLVHQSLGMLTPKQRKSSNVFSSMPFTNGFDQNSGIQNSGHHNSLMDPRPNMNHLNSPHQQQPYDNVVGNKQQLRGVSTLPGYF